MEKIFTIGFTQTTAEEFFTKIKKNSIKILIDTRINNSSQLAGFSKSRDLKFFLKEICGTDYSHRLDLAPTKDLLDAYKKKKITWEVYSEEFTKLIKKREIEKKYPLELLDKSCFLCSEKSPHYCHRRLVAEYLQENLSSKILTDHL